MSRTGPSGLDPIAVIIIRVYSLLDCKLAGGRIVRAKATFLLAILPVLFCETANACAPPPIDESSFEEVEMRSVLLVADADTILDATVQQTADGGYYLWPIQVWKGPRRAFYRLDYSCDGFDPNKPVRVLLKKRFGGWDAMFPPLFRGRSEPFDRIVDAHLFNKRPARFGQYPPFQLLSP